MHEPMHKALPSGCLLALCRRGNRGAFPVKVCRKVLAVVEMRKRNRAQAGTRRKIFVKIHQISTGYDFPPAGNTLLKQKNGGTPCPVRWRFAV